MRKGGVFPDGNFESKNGFSGRIEPFARGDAGLILLPVSRRNAFSGIPPIDLFTIQDPDENRTKEKRSVEG